MEELKKKASFRTIGKSGRRCWPSNKRNNRIISVDGHRVLQANNYVVKGGTYVFGGETSSSSSSSATTVSTSSSSSSTHSKGTRKQLDFEHGSLCNICWDGGTLLCCDRCPGTYHKACLEAYGLSASGQVGILKDSFVCPHHRCSTCGRGPSAAGGLIIACTECPAAFCEDHEPEGIVLAPLGCDRWQKLGQPARACTTTYFCQCSASCQRFNKTRLEHGELAAIAEQNEETKKLRLNKKKGENHEEKWR